MSAILTPRPLYAGVLFHGPLAYGRQPLTLTPPYRHHHIVSLTVNIEWHREIAIICRILRQF